MLQNILNLIFQYSQSEFSYNSDVLIEKTHGYEITNLTSYRNFKECFLDLYKRDLLNIHFLDYITQDKELKNIFNSYKSSIIQRKLLGERDFNTNDLIRDEKIEKFFKTRLTYLDLDIFVKPTNAFIPLFFQIIKEDKGTGEETKEEVGLHLYNEFNSYLNGRKSYSKNIEFSYILDEFIENYRYVYFLLKDLEFNNNLQIKNIIIKKGQIKFIILNITGIERKLFTNIKEKNKQNNIKYISEYKNDKLKICEVSILGTHKSKPGELIKLFYKLKKDGEYTVSYNDMRMYIIKNPNEFQQIKSTHFSEGQIREILRKKNEQISKKDELKSILKGKFFISEEKYIRVQK